MTNKSYFHYFFSSIFVIALLASCGGGKTKTPAPEIVTAEGVKVYNPKTGRYEFKKEVTGKVDTVEWRDASPTVNDPIASDPSQYLEETTITTTTTPTGSGVLSTYNVAIMMPFNANRASAIEGGIHSSSLSALSFYEGAKLAFDKLSKEGVNLKVHVMDTQRSESQAISLLSRNELQNAHMIIGPYSTKPLTRVADFAKENEKPLISPVNTSGKITTENPWYLQVNPSLKSHCEAILNHALENHAAENIVLVCRNKDAEVKRLKYFQNALKEIKGDANATPLMEYIIDATIADEFGEMENLPTYIKEGVTTVFIVPSYSNETFVSNFMRQLNISKLENDVMVYGMPRWMEFDRISYDYFEKLKLHVSSANFVDKENILVKDFYRQYFENYGTLPDDNALKGYDMTLYFGRQLNKNGTGFVNTIDADFESYLSTRYEFDKNVDEEAASNEDYSKVNFLENKFVNILKFEDYHFQKAN